VLSCHEAIPLSSLFSCSSEFTSHEVRHRRVNSRGDTFERPRFSESNYVEKRPERWIWAEEVWEKHQKSLLSEQILSEFCLRLDWVLCRCRSWGKGRGGSESFFSVLSLPSFFSNFTFLLLHPNYFSTLHSPPHLLHLTFISNGRRNRKLPSRIEPKISPSPSRSTMTEWPRPHKGSTTHTAGWDTIVSLRRSRQGAARMSQGLTQDLSWKGKGEFSCKPSVFLRGWNMGDIGVGEDVFEWCYTLIWRA